MPAAPTDAVKLAARLGVPAAALTRATTALNRVTTLPAADRLPALTTLTAGSGLGEVTRRDLLAVLPVSAPAELLAARNIGERRLARIVEAIERLGPAGVEAVFLPFECAARVAAAEQAAATAEARAIAAEQAAATSEARAIAAEQAAAAAEARAALLAAERDALLAAPAKSSLSPETLDVDRIAASIGQQLGATQRALADHPVRLGAVALTLRGVAESGGGKVGLRFGEAGPASEVRLAFVPATSPTVVPDVRGYTEPLARRKLLGVGLGVDVAPVRGATGVVLAQTPDPGTPITPDLRVRIEVGG